MALDVRLTRDVNERWGFELLGGADDEMPLTIQKLQPSSPAARAGLQNGDTILLLNNEEAIDFTHEEASRKIAECADSMTMAVMRGLYDPVLDDQEPIYYEPGDLDPESQPTEVPFKIQQFVEPADLGSSLIDYGNTNDPLGTPFDPSVLLLENRSLTASPYVNPTTPYRPFSTDPIPEIPPVEDPIILNPNYKDQFGESPVDINPDYILNAHNKNENVEPKYKLPISEQYDPDGTRKAKNAEVDSMLSKYVNMEMLSKKSVTTTEQISKTTKQDVNITEKTSKDATKTVSSDVTKKESLSMDVKEMKDSSKISTEETSVKETKKQESSIKKDVRITEQYESVTADMEEEIIREELKHIEKMKQERDISEIEEIALSVVEDSIERAVSVTEEIKKEMEEEFTSETKEAKNEKVTKSKMETKESKRVAKEEHMDDEVVRKEFKAQEKETALRVAKKDTEEAFESKSMIAEHYEEKILKETPRRKESYTQEVREGEFKKVTQTVSSGAKSDKTEAQQRTYAIGLKTIPNIRGVVQSSNHYNLLLHTFFIHLTDVMVALSRFVLTQPVFNTESHETVSHTQMYKRGSRDVKKSEHKVVETVKKIEKREVDDSKKKAEAKQEEIVEQRKQVEEKGSEIKAVSQRVEKDVKVEEKKVERRQLVTPVPDVKHEIKQEQKTDETVAIVEEKKSVSGAQMAQRTEKKLTKEMTQKMDAVISEFQTVAVEEDKKEMFQRSRRSRSRSLIEEEVAKESDPLVWLAKVDSRRASQEISEERLSKTEFSSSEILENKHFETLEKQEIKLKKTKTPKQMYRAIVEAHVYTDKDVIFEDAAEFSETSSVQSAEEINTALESLETMSTENVAVEALETAVQQLEQAKIVEESHELLRAHTHSEATVKKMDQVVHESSNIKHEEYKKETAIQSADTAVKEVVVQEIKEFIEPVVEIKESVKKESVAIGISESLAIAESSELNILESKSEFTSTESKKESAIQSTDVQEVVIQETKEIIEPIIEIKESIKKESVAIDINESLSIAESSQVNILESKSEFISSESKKELALLSTDVQEVFIQEATDIVEPVIEMKETIKKENCAVVDINESLSISESTEVNILEAKSEFTAIASKTESAKQSTDVQEIVIQETREIIEPVIEMKETIKKENCAVVDINESLSISESTEVNILEAKSEFTAIASKKESAKQSTDFQEIVIQETREIIEPVIEIKKENLKKETAVVDINESLSITESSEINILESKNEFTSVESKQGSVAIIEEEHKESAVVKTAVEVEEAPVQIEEVTENVVVKRPIYAEEFASIKIVKEVETEIAPTEEIVEVEEAVVKKVELSKLDLNAAKTAIVQSEVAVLATPDVSIPSPEFKTETKMITTKATSVASMSMRTGSQKGSAQSSPSIDTPSPTSGSTPLCEEYVFKFNVPLPKNTIPVPRDCSLSPVDEDPHIVKKKLIPHIETTIGEKVIYDPPLPTPPGDKIQSPIFKTPGLFGGGSKPVYKIKFPPVYRKPGLFGGADNPEYSKEEIREIERKSSLLASAIDETIKSIEEYKEEVGMENKKDVNVSEYKEEKVSKSYSKKVVIQSKQNGASNNTTVEIIEQNGDLSNGIDDSKVTIVEVTKEDVKVEKAAEATKQEADVKIKNKEIVKEVMKVENKKEVIKQEANVKLEKKEESQAESKVAIVKKEVLAEEVIKKETVQEEKKQEKTNIEILSNEKSIKEEAKVEVDTKKQEMTENITQKENVQSESKVEIQVESQTENKAAIEKKAATQETSIKNGPTEFEETKKKESETVADRVTETKVEVKEEVEIENKDPMAGYRPVVFDPAAIPKRWTPSVVLQVPSTQGGRQSPYITESGEVMGTVQGIVDGLEEPVMDPEVAKELGKPGISEEKIAELISGEAEMLREAHVMGLSRVLTSHMHRADDSVDFQKIKPLIDSLKDSEVLKALNEEMLRQKEEQKKKEEKKWTTFLQKPKRPVPKAKFGYHGWTENEQALVLEPYKVKIVKQAKPKVAPDYKPEDFETGPLPWEQRAELEASLPPVEPEEPILVPEVPEYLEAVDPLKESEVPDLEDTGLPLPPPKEPTPPPAIESIPEEPPQPEQPAQKTEVQEVESAVPEEKKETQEEMDNRLAQQLVSSVQSMVDPNASVEQQLAQMRAQLAALAQLPEVIQQTLELVSKQLNKMSHQEAQVSMSASHQESHGYQAVEVTQNHTLEPVQEGIVTENNEPNTPAENRQQNTMTIEEVENEMESVGQLVPQQENRRVLQTPQLMQQEIRVQTPQMTEEDIKMDKMKKAQQQQAKLEAESRQLRQRSTPRASKPKRVFGPLDPDSRPVVLPGGRRWRNTNDVYNEQKMAEMMQAQAELIQGKVLGFESELLPFDDRINFMKYEKPPVSLDHLQNSETYKLVHDMDQPPLKRIETRTPVICEADYRERCRSMTPGGEKKHLQIPQQFHP